MPLSQKGRSTDRLRLSRWTEDSIKSNVASGLSPSSTVAQPTVVNGDVSERSKVIKLSPGSKELLKFMYECLDTDSDDLISIADLNRKCTTYPEVATCLGMNLCRKGDQGWSEFLKSGQVQVTYEDLCILVSGLRRARRPDISLQTRRKLTYDFIRENFFVVTLFTIATVCVKHPIFLQFVIPPENAGNVGQVTDYFSQVDLAGGYAFSSKGRCFFDFCCFLDHVSSWTCPIAPTESLHGELMVFVSMKRNKLSQSHDEVNELGGSRNPLGRHTNTLLTSNARFIFPNAPFSSSHEFSPQTELREPRPLSSVHSDQSGKKKEIVCHPSGKVLLGRDQKPIGRSDLSFGDCGVLVGPDSMMIFDEDGHPFTKRKLCMAADGKPALDEHHRLKKLEQEKVAQRDIPEKKVSNKLSCSQKFFPASSQERDRAGLNGSGCIFSAIDGLPVNKGEVDGRDEHHRLTRKPQYERVVQKEVAEEKVNDLSVCSEKLVPVSGQGVPTEISPDRAFFDASVSCASTKDELSLGPSVDSLRALLDGPEWVAMAKFLQES